MSNNRRRLTGVVTRANTPKTVMVEVSRDHRHPLYEKVLRSIELLGTKVRPLLP